MRVEDVLVVRHSSTRVPDTFSWIGRLTTQPRDQGACGSCYALVATQVAEDRMGLHGNSVPHLDYMAVSEGGCIYYKDREGCIEGCNGGFVLGALEYLRVSGVPAQGDPNGQRYKIAGLYSLTGATHPDLYGVVSSQGNMPNLSQEELKHNADNIARDIMQSGPVCATFNMYSDFVDYVMDNPSEPYYVGWKQGVEVTPPHGDVHWTDKHEIHYETAHSVALVGFGVSPKGVPYWEVRNSWGGPGYIKIERNRNVSAIESSVEAPRVFGASSIAYTGRHGSASMSAEEIAIAVSLVVFVMIIVIILGVRSVK